MTPAEVPALPQTTGGEDQGQDHPLRLPAPHEAILPDGVRVAPCPQGLGKGGVLLVEDEGRPLGEVGELLQEVPLHLEAVGAAVGGHEDEGLVGDPGEDAFQELQALVPRGHHDGRLL